MLALKPRQMKYHRFENVKLVQRKEDENTVIQGEHCVFVFEKMESFVWDRCTGEYTIEDIVDDILALEDYCQNSKEDISEVVIGFIKDLKEQELIEYDED